MKNNENFELYKRFSSISVAAILDRLALHPIENIISTQQIGAYKPMQIIAKNIFNTQGISGFYSGMSKPLQLAIPYRLVMFSSYLYSKEYFIKQFNVNKAMASYFAGVVSGLCEAVVICPAESYRTRKLFKIDDAKKSYNLSLMYKGIFPLACRAMTSNSLTFSGSDIMLKNLPDKYSNDHRMPFITGLVAGGCSQFFAAPLDAWKTRVMKDTNDLPDIKHLSSLFKEGALYNSLKTRIMRNGLGNGIMIGVIHLINNLSDKYFSQGEKLDKKIINTLRKQG